MKLDPKNTYVIATRSNDWLAKAIRFFSEKGSKLYEFDHVVLYRNNEIIHMTLPRVKREPFEYRSENHIYEIKSFGLSEVAWDNAIASYERKEKYGRLQLVSKAFTMLLGLNPFKARQDCIEAILRWCSTNANNNNKFDRMSVAQGVKYLVDTGIIHKVGVVKK